MLRVLGRRRRRLLLLLLLLALEHIQGELVRLFVLETDDLVRIIIVPVRQMNEALWQTTTSTTSNCRNAGRCDARSRDR
uniref:Putative secreted protein n=1 Tax=Anopheles marajoara TaxID=58244 RepID=A0A2M4CC51_9DIPT